MRREGRAVWSHAARAWLPVGLFLVAGACEPILTSVGSWTDDSGPGHYLEAEDGALSGGFEIGRDSAASAGRYISPPFGVSSENAPGPARAVYEFSVGTPGVYRIWGRIRSPTAENNRFWVQVDDNAPIKWRISTGDIWYWDAFHNDIDYENPTDFQLAAGPHRITVANCVDGVDLDRLYYTLDPKDVPPGNDTPCSPPNSIEVNGACQLSCGSQGGKGCSIEACTGKPTLDAYDCVVCCKLP
jgi:hypothetical protein